MPPKEWVVAVKDSPIPYLSVSHSHFHPGGSHPLLPIGGPDQQIPFYPCLDLG